MSTAPEDARVLGAAAGDERAFVALIAEHDQGLRLFVAARAGSREQMEEVCHATWVEAWRGLAGFRGEAPFPAWLRGIARNLLRRELVRRARARTGGGTAELEAAAAESSPDDAGDEEAERRLRRMPACLETLSPRARAMLLARDRDGVPLADLARRFKQPMGALATLLWRIRAAMRLCLDGGAP